MINDINLALSEVRHTYSLYFKYPGMQPIAPFHLPVEKSDPTPLARELLGRREIFQVKNVLDTLENNLPLPINPPSPPLVRKLAGCRIFRIS